MKLPSISSDKILKILSKRGFAITRQKGSHISLHKREDSKTLLGCCSKKKSYQTRNFDQHFKASWNDKRGILRRTEINNS